MKKLIFTISLIFISTTYSLSQVNKEYQLNQADLKATNWFKNVNTSNFEEAFKGLSFEIQSKFDKNDWIIVMTQMMNSFGEFSERKEIYRNFVVNPIEIDPILGGFPDGYYAKFQYESNYKNTINHLETIILHQDHKSKWKVIDYSYEFLENDSYKED